MVMLTIMQSDTVFNVQARDENVYSENNKIEEL